MIFLYILIGIIVLVGILAMLAPKSYRVERSIQIDKPLPEVFTYLKSLKAQDEWSPWGRRDPNMHKEFFGTDGTVGATSAWDGNKEVGKGEQEITKIVENERIESELRFLKPMQSTSDAFMVVDDAGEGQTKVTWGFQGKNKFPGSIFMLFMSMDKLIGKDFEEGLVNLKQNLEA